MPDNNDYRDLLNEKFKNLNDKIDIQHGLLHNTMKNVEGHVTKTNGRVNDLEDKVNGLDKIVLTREISCPKNKSLVDMSVDIKDLKKCMDEKLEDLSFFTRHPKLGLLIIIVSVLFTLYSYFGVTTYLNNMKEAHKTEISK